MKTWGTRALTTLCVLGACWPLALASCTPIAPHAEYIHNLARETKRGDERCASRAENDAGELRRCATVRAAMKSTLMQLEGGDDAGL